MKNCSTYTFRPLRKRLIMLSIGLFFLSGMAFQQVFAQCTNDVTPPNAVCQGTISRDILNNGTVVVTAQEFDNGSTDNCTPAGALSYFIELSPASSVPPTTTSLTFTGSQVGTHSIVLWVVDTSGNAANCTSTLQVTLCVATVACNDQITIQLDANNAGIMTPDDGLEGGPYCSFYTKLIRLDPFSGGAPAAPSIILGPQHIGTHVYSVTLSPIQNTCWGNVTIIGSPCVNDQIPPTAVCNEFTLVVLDTSLAPTVLAEDMNRAAQDTPFRLTLISNRGTQVWPTGSIYTECVDYCRVRFELRDGVAPGTFGQARCIALLDKIAEKFTVGSYELLRTFDGVKGYSLAQGQ